MGGLLILLARVQLELTVAAKVFTLADQVVLVELSVLVRDILEVQADQVHL
jgi:hypothetical protein